MTDSDQKKRGRRGNILIPVLLTAALLAGCTPGNAELTEEKQAFPPVQTTPAVLTETKSEDDQAPKIEGIHDFEIYQGDTISYLKDLTVTDNVDPEAVITVDSSRVDLSRPGCYDVIYTVTDKAGNKNLYAARVTVLERKPEYVNLDIIYETADELLKEIIRENATDKQQIHDVYAWARLNLTFSGHSDRTDWRQTAYTMMTDGRGDCYGFFAVTKLLFERLGIPNIDVQKVRNNPNDTDHFWSLVSYDNEETWYHFDATPRHGDGDDFCLVTDAFLDAYSDSHDGCHNRDKSLYPQTP